MKHSLESPTRQDLPARWGMLPLHQRFYPFLHIPALWVSLGDERAFCHKVIGQAGLQCQAWTMLGIRRRCHEALCTLALQEAKFLCLPLSFSTRHQVCSHWFRHSENTWTTSLTVSTPKMLSKARLGWFFDLKQKRENPQSRAPASRAYSYLHVGVRGFQERLMACEPKGS